MITEPFWKISKKLLKRKKRWDTKLNSRNSNFFSLVTSLENDDRQFQQLSKKLAPGSKHHKKMNLAFLVHRSARNHKQTYWKKINELEKSSGIVEELDAHCGFLFWKIASVCQSCCTPWEPVHVLIIQLVWKNMTKPYATGFPKCVTWTSTIFRGLSWLCPLRWVVLGFHPHHY